jgi:predicted flap endonuclease-1-like 5' DNA nuclease
LISWLGKLACMIMCRYRTSVAAIFRTYHSIQPPIHKAILEQAKALPERSIFFNSLEIIFQYESMTYSISKIDGLGPQAQAKLKAEGIRTTAALLEQASTVKARKALSAKTGIGEQQLLAWANIADCMRIKGMGKAKAELLRAAGVNTVREFALRNPERLAQAMKDANDKRKLVRVLPSEKSVAQLIQHARKLPLKISY